MSAARTVARAGGSSGYNTDTRVMGDVKIEADFEATS